MTSATPSLATSTVCSRASARRRASARGASTRRSIVGNATMLHLLLGIDPRVDRRCRRSSRRSSRRRTSGRPTPASTIHPEGRLVLFPSIGAYVGADIVGRHGRDRHRARADVVAAPGRRRHERRDRRAATRTGSVTTAAPAGPGVRGRPDPARHARHRGRDRGRRPRRRAGEVRPPGDRRRRRAPRHLRQRPDRRRRAAAARRPPERRAACCCRPTRRSLAGHPLAEQLRVDDEGVRAFALDRRRPAHAARRPRAPVRPRARSRPASRPRCASAGSSAGRPGRGPARRFVRHLHRPARAPACVGLVPPVAVEQASAPSATRRAKARRWHCMSFREREVAVRAARRSSSTWSSPAPRTSTTGSSRNLAFPPLEVVAPERAADVDAEGRAT